MWIEYICFYWWQGTSIANTIQFVAYIYNWKNGKFLTGDWYK